MPFHKPRNHSLIESQDLIGLSRTRVYFVYSNSDHRHWYVNFLKKGFQHVYCVKFDGFFWTRMDLSLGWTDFDVLHFDRYDTIKDVLKGQDVTYQYVERWREPRYRVRTLFAPWTCVEAMKSLIGIRKPLVFTPYQLYKHLEK